MKDVVVTGGGGFIGRALVRRLEPLVEPGRRVVVVRSRDADLTDREATFRWFERHHSAAVTHVFQLAAVYKAGGGGRPRTRRRSSTRTWPSTSTFSRRGAASARAHV